MNSDPIFFGGAVTASLVVRESPRAKVMRLRVDPRTATVLLTVPRRSSRKRAVQWAEGHRQWIESTLAKIPARVAIAPGSSVPFLGTPHLIDWEEGRARGVTASEGALIAGGPADALEARILRWMKQHARILLETETREFAAKAGVTVTRVGIGDPVSRWGSCSTSGAIRYSWRLVLAPEWVRRATVAHEVAHRVHMNHGPEFHALVERLLGVDPTPARQWLKQHGASVHRIGTGAR